MAGECKLQDDLSTRPLDRGLIDRIVKEQKNLPAIENFDQMRRKAVWERYREKIFKEHSQKLPKQDDFHYSWEVEFLELSLELDFAPFFGVGTSKKDEPLPLEVAIAYAYCLTLRPEIWRYILNTRAVLPLFKTIENKYMLTPSQFVQKHGKSVGIVDYDLHHVFYQQYKTYFGLKYGSKFKQSSYTEVVGYVKGYAEAGRLDEDALKAYILQSRPDCFV